MLEHITLFMQDIPPPLEAINIVYEILIINLAILYLHGAAGFPTNYIWIKAIWKGNYIYWPHINVKNVNKNFPESERDKMYTLGTNNRA